MTAHAKRGLSLLEMLIVLAVLSILLGIGALNLTRLTQQKRVDEAARTIGETLRLVGGDAAKKSLNVVLEVSDTALSWQAEGEEPRRRILPNAGTMVLKELGKENVSNDDIRFTGRGFPSQGYSFEVTVGELNKTVNLLATGAVVYP